MARHFVCSSEVRFWRYGALLLAATSPTLANTLLFRLSEMSRAFGKDRGKYLKTTGEFLVRVRMSCLLHIESTQQARSRWSTNNAGI